MEKASENLYATKTKSVNTDIFKDRFFQYVNNSLQNGFYAEVTQTIAILEEIKFMELTEALPKLDILLTVPNQLEGAKIDLAKAQSGETIQNNISSTGFQIGIQKAYYQERGVEKFEDEDLAGLSSEEIAQKILSKQNRDNIDMYQELISQAEAELASAQGDWSHLAEPITKIRELIAPTIQNQTWQTQFKNACDELAEVALNTKAA